jgi:hypothetical protein
MSLVFSSILIKPLLPKTTLLFRPYYPLANEVAKGYSNATVRRSFRNILVNTLESTSFNGFTKFGQNPLKDVDSRVFTRMLRGTR